MRRERSSEPDWRSWRNARRDKPTAVVTSNERVDEWLFAGRLFRVVCVWFNSSEQRAAATTTTTAAPTTNRTVACEPPTKVQPATKAEHGRVGCGNSAKALKVPRARRERSAGVWCFGRAAHLCAHVISQTPVCACDFPTRKFDGLDGRTCVYM